MYHRVYNEHVRGTPEGKIVPHVRVSVCSIKESIRRIIEVTHQCDKRTAMFSTMAMKHIHDGHIYKKHVPDDLPRVLGRIGSVLKYPDEVRRNRPEKSGDFLFVQAHKGHTYVVATQAVIDDGTGRLEVVSAFLASAEYLDSTSKDTMEKHFPILWSRGTANSPS